MLFALNALIGSPVQATDGRIGSVKDFLFHDQSWKVRWMVVGAGSWLTGRKVLIHPSAIAPLEIPPKPLVPMMSFGDTLTVFVRLTKQQIEASPDAREDEPVTAHMEAGLYDYYGWDPVWGTSFFGGDAVVQQSSGRSDFAEVAESRGGKYEAPPAGDPYLGGVADVIGYRVHATDGDIGHVENLLADDENWDIRYLIVSTRNWLPGKQVLLAPYAVADIDWAERKVIVNVTREQIRTAPEWDPLAMENQILEEQLHRHFGWPGYGWKKEETGQ
jgi:PRC-barrel domain